MEPKNQRRDWRRRYHVCSQWDAKGRRCKGSHRNSVANRNHNRQGLDTWIGVTHRFAHRAQTERKVWTGRTGRRRTTEENDKKRRFEIVILVLVALGALAAGAGATRASKPLCKRRHPAGSGRAPSQTYPHLNPLD